MRRFGLEHNETSATRWPAGRRLGGITLARAPAFGVDTVCWGNFGNSTLSYAALNGSGGGQLSTEIAPVDQPIGVALDPRNGWLFWADNGKSTFGYVALNGSSSGSTGSSDVDGPVGIAIDPRSNTIFWANNSSNTIGSMRLAGADRGLMNTGAAKTDRPGFPVLLEAPRPGGSPGWLRSARSRRPTRPERFAGERRTTRFQAANAQA